MPHSALHQRTDFDRPLVIWDGECPFCLGSIRLLRRLVGDAIDEAPYQQVHKSIPNIGLEAFDEAVYLLEPDGRAYHGAEAVYRALDHGESRILSLGRWLYDRFDWFARLSEWGYEWVSRHRPQLTRLFRPLLPTG